MKIRSANELKSLDDEINLFDEKDWDFLSVVDTQDSNFEYFNDIRDTDFDKRSKFKLKDNIIPIVSMLALLVTCTVITINVTGILDNNDYDEVKGMQSVNQSVTVDYVDGVGATSDKFLAISGVLNKYFSCLHNKNSYDSLYDYCSVTSTFADTYSNSVNKVETLYDRSDCYARALREFGSFCTLQRVNKVIVKDNTYYCYANVSIPTSTDVYEYCYLYSYNFTREFSAYLPTEAAVVKYFLELTGDNKVPCSTTEVCFKFVEKDGEFKLVDDSFITSTCVDAYTSAVTQITTLLGSSLSN